MAIFDTLISFIRNVSFSVYLGFTCCSSPTVMFNFLYTPEVLKHITHQFPCREEFVFNFLCQMFNVRKSGKISVHVYHNLSLYLYVIITNQVYIKISFVWIINLYNSPIKPLRNQMCSIFSLFPFCLHFEGM